MNDASSGAPNPGAKGRQSDAATSGGVDELLRIARQVAEQAGELILRRRDEGVSVAATKSTSLDIVTDTDRESENLIRSLLADARPNDAFFGEESDATGGTSGLTWVVDPIDGTVNFLYGIPDYAVSIAVVEGEPDPESWNALAGVVVNPSRRETFAATSGGGAFLTDSRHGTRQLFVNSDVALSRALIGTGFGYDTERKRKQAEVVSRLISQIRDIRRAGVASVDLCSVAAGRLDGFFERGLQPWDHAAGAIIAAEAGARVGGLSGRSAGERMVIAAEPALFAALEQLLSELKAGDL